MERALEKRRQNAENAYAKSKEQQQLEIDRKIQNLIKRQDAKAAIKEQEKRQFDTGTSYDMEGGIADTRAWSGIGPIFGRNLFSIIVTDLINMLINPVWTTIFRLIMDLVHFYVIPLVGGVFAVIIKHDYEQEKNSFDLAGLDMFDLYTTDMNLIKDTVYTIVGRPMMYD